ncbi:MULTISPECIES: NADH-dependent flavin oxidoreductase [unclassified Enterococcus]|jgi:2,4-dienoyl-CoA reductase-like NADH-dependent reductase (Old Yellow Enzyme family)|uniref:NADH-dependent flavin oxidoreductase n=1 Tax=unclassified Enterococcus TaxID=2608891 RepID=UPI003D273BF0
MANFKETFQFKNGSTLRNRLMLSPMTTEMSFYNGIVTQDELRYYANRSHDLGAVITGAANVQAIGQGWKGELGVYDDRFIPGLTKLAKSIQAGGAKAILQIFHGGRMTPTAVIDGQQPVSASAVPAERPDAPTPLALTGEEVLAVIEDFKKAAIRAVKAGFDGIEIHGANTYLIQQFFSPHSNRREDEWGGSLENRYHFVDVLVDEVIAGVKQATSEPFIIGYRFSPEEFETPGIRMEHTLYLVDHLAEKELDYLHVSLNTYDRVSVEEAYQEKTILAYMQEKIAGRLPLIGVGSIETADDIEKTLQSADLAAVGQAMLVDPDWAKKILADQPVKRVSELPEEIRALFRISIWDYVDAVRGDKR